MGILVGLVVGLLAGMGIAGALTLFAVRASYPRLGVGGAKEYLSLLLHEILPERLSRFDKLEPKVARRLTDERVVLTSGVTLAMGHFALTFASADLEELRKLPDEILARNFETYYLTYARKQGWQLPKNGHVSFTLRQDSGFKPGSFSVIASPVGHEQLPAADLLGVSTAVSTVPAMTGSLSAADAATTIPFGECHVVIRSSDQAKSFSSAGGTVRIGRANSNEFRILSPGVSRLHAVLVHSGHGWTIAPVKETTNGVYKGSVKLNGTSLIAETGKYTLGREAAVEILPECSHGKNGAV